MNWMNKITLTALLFIGIGNLNAQDFKLGDNVGAVGIGLGSSLGSGLGSASPGFAFQYEHGQWDVGGPGTISLGGYLGYKAFIYSNYTILGLRSAYHYHGLDVKNLDPYGGAMLSYNFFNATGDNPHGVSSGIYLSLYLGARYYFNSNWAAYAEFGYGVSYLTLGAAYHF